MLNKLGHELTLSWLEANYGDDYLVEEMMYQSDFMANFCHTSINTIRMITLRVPKTNQIVCLNAVLRIGKNGSEVDNACQGGSFVGIFDDGSLGKYVCDGIGRTSKVFNGIDFEKTTFIIPNYEQVKKFAINVHERVLHQDLVAMDIALKTNNEPTLIEINVGAFSSNLFQLTTRSTFNDYTDVVMNYCVNKIQNYEPEVWY